jgi:protein-S-isoprenylcysteine O-methyltransferase Ste14
MFENRPNRLPWPPMIYAASAGLAVVLHQLSPLPWFSSPFDVALRWLGIALIAAAITIDIAAVIAFRRHNTTILPNKATSRLITNGIFALSRNPIYVGNTLLLTGAGLAFGIAWMVIAVPVAVFAVTKLAIEREEMHLAANFDQDWQDYRARTPRWLGSPRG